MHARTVHRDPVRFAVLAALLLTLALYLSPAFAQAPREADPEPPPAPEAPAPEAEPDGDTPVTPEPARDAEPERVVALGADGAVHARDAEGARLWAWRPAAGVDAAPVTTMNGVWIGTGPYLVRLDPADGSVLERVALPFVPDRLEPGEPRPTAHRAAGPDALSGPRATGGDADPDAGPGTGTAFGLDPRIFTALRDGAAGLPAGDAAAAAERDPTDPWLALRAAEVASDPEARAAWTEEAIARAGGLPFFETANVALRLFDMGRSDEAGVLMNAALHAAHEAGYDPRLLVDGDLRAAYGMPHDAFVRALDRGDVPGARPLAPFAWRTAAEAAPETIIALERFADALRAAGERQEAGIWRDRARELRHAGLSAWIDGAAVALGRLGWSGVAGLAVAFAATWLVLLAKVWRGQSLLRRQARERGLRPRSVSRLWIPRAASTTEKLALLVLLAAITLQTVLAGWGTVDETRLAALRSGTLANAEARAVLAELEDHGHAEALRGLAAVLEDRDDEAVRAFEAAGPIGWARTNLALLTTDPGAARDEALREALRLDPREPVARWATGREVHPSPFHEAYGDAERVWAVPTARQTRFAVIGDWRDRLAQVVAAPATSVRDTRPAAVPIAAWWTVVILFAAFALAIAAFLALRRPAAVRDAPRSPAYPIGALLVPGSGHADELWGLLLLLPWALVGADAVLSVTTGASALGLAPWVQGTVLGLVYAAGIVGWAIEAQAYRRRMRRLREEKPALAKAYGLPPAPVRTDARKGPPA